MTGTRTTSDYNVIIDIGHIQPDGVDLDVLAVYHAVAAGTPTGSVELILTMPAESLLQAITTTLSAVQALTRYEPFVVRAMSTAAFDAGYDIVGEPDTLSVGEAADRLGVTASAVRQRLSAGSLAGRRVGRDWRLPLAIVEAEALIHPKGAVPVRW